MTFKLTPNQPRSMEATIDALNSSTRDLRWRGMAHLQRADSTRVHDAQLHARDRKPTDLRGGDAS